MKTKTFRIKVLIPLLLMILTIFSLLIALVSWQSMTTLEESIMDTSEIITNSMYNLLETIHSEIERERALMLDETEKRLIHLEEAALSVVGSYHQSYLDGDMSLASAQKQAKETIRLMRYGKNGYYWIDNEEYILTMHPYLGDKEGISREALVDSNGVQIVKRLVDESVKNGSTFLEFWFPKERGGDPFPKLGCGMYFEPWGWVVNTGEYIDSIDADMLILEKKALAQLNRELTEITYLNAYGFIRDGDLSYIAHQDQSLVNVKEPLSDSQNGESLDDYFRTIKDGSVEYYYSREGEGSYQKVGYVRYFEPWDMIIVYAVYQDDIDMMVGALRNIVIFAGGLSMVLMLLVTFFVLRSVSRPLTSMTEILDDISRGEGDLTTIISVETNDEFGLIATHFNDFIGKIRTMVADLKDVSRASRDMGDNLSVNITEISASTTEMAATVKSLHDHVETQTQRVESANEEIRLIKEQISQVNQNIGREENALEESSSAVNQMLASLGNLSRISTEKKVLINDLSDHAEKSGSAMNETARDIREISNSVDTITELADVINGVSDQINLLSMNAAIEAAHAGEAGRGFAVVADEIRKLAETTGEQSGRITQSISQIASMIGKSGESSQRTEISIGHITANIDEITTTFNEIIQGMEELTAGSSDITRSLEQLEGSSKEVKGSAEQVDRSADSIMGIIGDVKDLSVSNSQGIQEVMLGTDQIALVINNLDQMGNENKETVETLDKKLNQFKVE
ncbi:MAG: methyl-accepting chemotaxis protein [Spirochaetales bacterium]|nr:methyl-accepting chemotaxis protein [Spirochaetales bacterium]